MTAMPLRDVAQNAARVTGGRYSRHDGEDFVRLAVGEHIIECSPGVVGGTLALDCSVSGGEFGKLLQEIDGEGHLIPFAWFQVMSNTKEISEASLVALLIAATAEAEQLSLREIVSKFVTDPSGKTSVAQLCHLAALASTGDFVALMGYRESLSGQARNPFVPMITQAHLERAIDLALQRT